MIDRRRLVLLAVTCSLIPFAPAAAQEATPASFDDIEGSITGLASRGFSATDPSAPGIASVTAIAVAFDSDRSATAGFRVLFDILAFGMLDDGDAAVDAAAPAVGDEAAARTLRVGGVETGDADELAVIGFRAGPVVVIVSARAEDASPLDALSGSVERIWRRAAFGGATPAPAGSDLETLLPTQADLPPGLAPDAEDAVGLDD